jgi:hypothetical protein
MFYIFFNNFKILILKIKKIILLYFKKTPKIQDKNIKMDCSFVTEILLILAAHTV